VALVCLAGWSCSGWHRVGAPDLATAEERQQAQVWRGGRAVQLHALRLTADSISGVPFIQSPSCDSCRVSFSRADVDSVRVGDPEGEIGAGLMGGALVVLLFHFYVRCLYTYCGGT